MLSTGRVKTTLFAALVLVVLAGVLPVAQALRSPTQLRNARVPAVCGHPAGNLVDGTLPGIPENFGHVTLDEDRVAVGRFIPGRRREAAAVVTCNAGGVSHPDNIVFYNANGRMVGFRRLGAEFGSNTAFVRNIWIDRGTVHVQVANIAQDGDALCCGTASAKLEFRWDRDARRMVMTEKKVFNERQVVRKLVRAINNDNRRRALRFAEASVVDELLSWDVRLGVGGCTGLLEPRFFFPRAFRECSVFPADGGFFVWFLEMEQTSWRNWRITDSGWTSTN